MKDAFAEATAELHVFEPAGSVTVTYGEEVYSPVQYMSFRIGPFSITRSLRPGEQPKDVIEGIEQELSEMADRQFERRLRSFHERYSKVSKGGR